MNISKRIFDIEQNQEKTMAQARWNGEVVAKNDQTVMVEGNHYFPRCDGISLQIMTTLEPGVFLPGSNAFLATACQTYGW